MGGIFAPVYLVPVGNGLTTNNPANNIFNFVHFPIILLEEEAEESIVFEVSPADFGISTEVSYVIQMDRPGNNFATPFDLGSNSSTTVLVEVAEINRRAISKGITPGETETWNP